MVRTPVSSRVERQRRYTDRRFVVSSETCSLACLPAAVLAAPLFDVFTTPTRIVAKLDVTIRRHGHSASAVAADDRLPTVRAGDRIARGVHGQSDRERRPLRIAVRRLDGLSRPARRADGERVDSDRAAGDLSPQAARWLDEHRE